MARKRNEDFTDINYGETLQSANGVLMFFKKNCPACKALEKMLDKFFNAHPDIPYMGINSEACPDAVKAFDIVKIPTLLILKDGHVMARKAGLMNLTGMEAFYRSVSRNYLSQV